MKRCFVITTGRGEVYVTLAKSRSEALTDFGRKFMGLQVASIVEAVEF